VKGAFFSNEIAKIPKRDQSRNTSRNINQRNKWANTDPQIYRRWDQVPRKSKHSLSNVICYVKIVRISKSKYEN
jgi:hypothetical protein